MFDEMLLENGTVRPHYEGFERWKTARHSGFLEGKKAEADHLFRQVGITFSVYGDDVGTERLIPLIWCPGLFRPRTGHVLRRGCRSGCRH